MKNNYDKNISNLELSRNLKNNYAIWKDNALKTEGYFIIFNKFSDSKLKNISGNALKLYIYLGIHSNTTTGEVWHSNKTIAEYFNKSERTIRLWMKELERINLVYRLQLKFNEESHTYLQPYIVNLYIKSEKFSYTFRFKNLFNRKNINLLLFEDKIIALSKKYFKNKLYFIFKEQYFEIQTFTPLNTQLLNTFPKYLTQELKEILDLYFSIYSTKITTPEKRDNKYIIENYKNKPRYRENNAD